MYIKPTRPCKSYPTRPHFHIIEIGSTGEYIIPLIPAPRQKLPVQARGGSSVHPDSMLRAEMRKISYFSRIIKSISQLFNHRMTNNALLR